MTERKTREEARRSSAPTKGFLLPLWENNAGAHKEAVLMIGLFISVSVNVGR